MEGELPPLPPPLGCEVFVDDDGSLGCRSDDLEVLLAFDQWRFKRACPHAGGVLLHHRIGNLATVTLLRNELQRSAASFSFILDKVLYNGTHGGNFIAAEEIPTLKSELLALSEFHRQDADQELFVRGFERQMFELVDTSLKIGKPISF